MLRHISIVSLLVLLTACGTSPKTDFYMLNAENEYASVAPKKDQGAVIAIWTVRLPDYLDRSEIVVRESQYEVELADFSWWAGDLGQNITRLLAIDLGQRLQSNRIVASTWGTRYKKDFQIKTHIARFDGQLGGEVVFNGVWTLLDGDGKKELSREGFDFKTTATDKTYKGLVAALSQLTVKLSEQMGSSIKAYKAESK